MLSLCFPESPDLSKLGIVRDATSSRVSMAFSKRWQSRHHDKSDIDNTMDGHHSLLPVGQRGKLLRTCRPKLVRSRDSITNTIFSIGRCKRRDCEVMDGSCEDDGFR